MATTTQMADRVCQVTGLATTGADRALVVSALNQSADYSALEIGNNVASFTAALTADDGDYTLSAAPFSLADLLELRQLHVVAQGATYPLRLVSEARMMQQRAGMPSSGIPLTYSLRGTTEILFWPTPMANVSVVGSYLKAPLELVESSPSASQEITPSWIPKALHYEVIVNRATCIVLERENRFEEGQVYEAKSMQAIERASMWHSRFGGPSIDDGEVEGYGYERDRDR